MCDWQNNLGSYFTAYMQVTDLQPDFNHERVTITCNGTVYTVVGKELLQKHAW
jgi:hypothetical protein